MDAQSVLDFMLLAGLLKTNKRTGWLLRGIENPESVADHQYRMALTASIAWTGGRNSAAGNPVLVALVHDIAEALVGDFAPHDNITKRDKRVLEAAALRTLRACLGWSTPPAKALQAAWEEYEHQTSPAGSFVKQLDKLEMCVQALEYEASHSTTAAGCRGACSSSGVEDTAGGGLRVQLDEFYEGVHAKLSTPLLQGCFSALKQRRGEVLGTVAADPSPEPPHPSHRQRQPRARSTSRQNAAIHSRLENQHATLLLPSGATDPRQAFLPLDPVLLEQLRGGALLQPEIVQRFAGNMSPVYRELIEGALRRAGERMQRAQGVAAGEAGGTWGASDEAVCPISSGDVGSADDALVDWGAVKSGSDADDALLLVCGVLVCFALLQLLLD